MPLVDVVDCATIGNYIPVEPPLATQHVPEQLCARTGRLAVYAVVSTHHGGRARFHNSRTESRPVSLTHIAFVCGRVKTMAVGLRTRMNRVVLGSGNDFQILRIVTLQSVDECHTETAGEVRIFSVSLLATSPAWIAKDIDVWRPERQTVKPIVVTTSLCFVILGAPLVRDHRGDAIHQWRIKGGSESDRLRENCRYAG